MRAGRPLRMIVLCATLLGAAALVTLLTGCGTQPDPGATGASGATTTASASRAEAGAGSGSGGVAAPKPHPQAIQPVAGAAAVISAPAQASVSVGPPSRTLPQPITEAQVRGDLARSGMTANLDQATLTPAGLAVAPINAPAAVQEVIAAGNTIANLPYRYGGGHATYQDSAYDCSGSISYVFAAAHLLDHTVASGELETWGAPGPGKWITIFANAGHTFMYVAGLRFDTVALAETGSRWSEHSATEHMASFSVRHPPGL